MSMRFVACSTLLHYPPSIINIALAPSNLPQAIKAQGTPHPYTPAEH